MKKKKLAQWVPKTTLYVPMPFLILTHLLCCPARSQRVSLCPLLSFPKGLEGIWDPVV